MNATRNFLFSLAPVLVSFLFLSLTGLRCPAQEKEDEWTLEKVIGQLEENTGNHTLEAKFDLTLPERFLAQEKPIRNGGRISVDADRFVKLRAFSWMFRREPFWFQLGGTGDQFGYRIAHMPVPDQRQGLFWAARDVFSEPRQADPFGRTLLFSGGGLFYRLLLANLFPRTLLTLRNRVELTRRKTRETVQLKAPVRLAGVKKPVTVQLVYSVSLREQRVRSLRVEVPLSLDDRVTVMKDAVRDAMNVRVSVNRWKQIENWEVPARISCRMPVASSDQIAADWYRLDVSDLSVSKEKHDAPGWLGDPAIPEDPTSAEDVGRKKLQEETITPKGLVRHLQRRTVEDVERQKLDNDDYNINPIYPLTDPIISYFRKNAGRIPKHLKNYHNILAFCHEHVGGGLFGNKDKTSLPVRSNAPFGRLLLMYRHRWDGEVDQARELRKDLLEESLFRPAFVSYMYNRGHFASVRQKLVEESFEDRSAAERARWLRKQVEDLPPFYQVCLAHHIEPEVNVTQRSVRALGDLEHYFTDAVPFEVPEDHSFFSGLDEKGITEFVRVARCDATRLAAAARLRTMGNNGKATELYRSLEHPGAAVPELVEFLEKRAEAGDGKTIRSLLRTIRNRSGVETSRRILEKYIVEGENWDHLEEIGDRSRKTLLDAGSDRIRILNRMSDTHIVDELIEATDEDRFYEALLQRSVKKLNPANSLRFLELYHGLNEESRSGVPERAKVFLQSLRNKHPAAEPDLRELWGDLQYREQTYKRAFEEYRSTLALESLLASVDTDPRGIVANRVLSFRAEMGVGGSIGFSSSSGCGFFHRPKSRSDLDGNISFAPDRSLLIKLALAGKNAEHNEMKPLITKYADLENADAATEADALQIAGNEEAALAVLREAYRQKLANWRKERDEDDARDIYCSSIFRKYIVYLFGEDDYLTAADVLQKSRPFVQVREAHGGGPSPLQRDWRLIKEKLLNPVRVPDRWIRKRTESLEEEQKEQLPSLLKKLGAKEYQRRNKARKKLASYSGRVLIHLKERLKNAEDPERTKQMRHLVEHHFRNIAGASGETKDQNGNGSDK